jgi:hypothetical protein
MKATIFAFLLLLMVVCLTAQPYSVDITSTPDSAEIWIDGVDTGYTSPYTFYMDEGSSATYTVQIMDYTWVPTEFVVTNIVSNMDQHFVGTYVEPYDGIIEPGIPEFIEPPLGCDLSGITVLIPADAGVDFGYYVRLFDDMSFQPPHPYLNNSNTFGIELNSIDFIRDDIDWIYELTEPGLWWVKFKWGGEWHHADPYPSLVTTPPGYVTIYNVPYDTSICTSVTKGDFDPDTAHVVDITAYTPQGVPLNAKICVDGVDSGYTTPHTFWVGDGHSATYTVCLCPYVWNPQEFVVTNLTTNTYVNFIGTYINPPHCLNPENGATDVPIDTTILVWGIDPFLPPGCSFELHYGTMLWPPQVVYTGTDMSYYPGQLAYDTEYYWYVKLICPESCCECHMDSTLWHFSSGTTPVELSSFTATPTADYLVNLQWTTESETNLSGYYIYRNTEESLDSALRVSNLIAGTNSSQVTDYNYTDTEVVLGSSYYYWLQSMDLDGTVSYYGPISVTLNNPDDPHGTPEIPVNTCLLPVYPNPFKPFTNIPYFLKTPETVQISIYNCRGQLVRSYQQTHATAGTFSVTFDGTDAGGRDLSNGVYYCTMKAGKYSSTTKMVLLK